MRKKQTWMGITKGLLLGATLSVSLLLTENAYAANGVSASAQPGTMQPIVTYANETVKVGLDADSNGEIDANEACYFFTTTAVKATKIPATNKWERTIGGSVDVSAYPNGKTIYFANSTSPAYEDIVTVVVPPQPKFKTIAYKAAAKSDDAIAMLGTPKVTVAPATGKKNVDITLAAEDLKSIQYRKKDTENFMSGENFLTSLTTFQKSGATVEFRTVCQDDQKAVKGEDGNYYFSGADFLPSAESSKASCVAGAFLRPGVIKTVKVTKLAAAPAVSIDFANHAFTVKKGQQYAKVDASFPITGSWSDAAKANQVVYFKDNEVYIVRTAATATKAASLSTFITTGTTKSFADSYGTNSKVTVAGGKADVTHVMTISRTMKTVAEGATAAQKKAANPAQAYEYMIVDSADAYVKDGILDYETIAGDVKAKKVKWVKASIAATKSSVTVNLKSVVGKQIILRAAKGTNVLSSQYIILTAPKADSAADKNDGVDYWTQKAQGAESATSCLNISNTAKYLAASKTIEITAQSAAEVDENAKIKVNVSYKNGKKTVATDIESPIVVAEGVATIKVPIESLALNADATALTLTIPEGSVVGLDGAANGVKTIKTTVDTKAPILSWGKVESTKGDDTMAAGKLTLALDSAIVLPGEDGKEPIKLDTAAVTLKKEQCAEFIKVYKVGAEAEGADAEVTVEVTGEYTYVAKTKKRTLVLNFEMDETSSYKYKVAISGATDIAGNPVAAKEDDEAAVVADGTIAFSFANPAYVAVQEVKFNKSVYEVQQNGEIDLTKEFVINPENATNIKNVTWELTGDADNNISQSTSAGDRIHPTNTIGKYAVGTTTAGKTGTVKITIDGKTAECTIKVVEKAQEPAPSEPPTGE